MPESQKYAILKDKLNLLEQYIISGYPRSAIIEIMRQVQKEANKLKELPDVGVT